MPLKILIIVCVLAIPIVPTFWAIMDIPRRRFPTPRKKVIWLFAVSTFPLIGAVFYVLVGRRQTEPLHT